MTQIVIIGVHSNFVSIPLLEAVVDDVFYSKIGKPVIALTRDASNVPVTSDRINYVEWADASDLDKIFEAADLVINTTGPRSDWDGITDAVIRAKDRIRAYIPSEFGSDSTDFAIQPMPQGFQRKLDLAKRVRDAGVKVIEVQTGAIDGKVGHIPAGFASIAGLNYRTNQVTFTGNPDTLYHATWNEDVGKAVAGIAALYGPDFTKVPDYVNIFSYAVTQRTVVERYSKQLGVSLTYEDSIPYEKALQTAVEQSIAGDRSLPAFMQILHVLTASGPGKGMFFEKDHRELVNPGESLFKWKSF